MLVAALIDYLDVLAWPLIVLVLVGYFFIKWGDEIRALIGPSRSLCAPCQLRAVHGNPKVVAALAPTLAEEEPDDSFLRVPLPPRSVGAVLAEQYRA